MERSPRVFFEGGHEIVVQVAIIHPLVWVGLATARATPVATGFHVLHWHHPGAVWAMDHSDPPMAIDGRWLHILARSRLGQRLPACLAAGLR